MIRKRKRGYTGSYGNVWDVMNGFEFLEEYKKLEEKLKSKVVIVMLTTSLNPDDRERALATKEVTEFQNKPLTIETLNEIIEKYF